MAEFTERSLRDAERIVDQMLDDESQRGFDIDSDIVLSDVQRDAIEFSGELDLLNIIGSDAPAIRDPQLGPIPVSLRSILGLSDWLPVFTSRTTTREWWRSYYRFYMGPLQYLMQSLPQDAQFGELYAIDRDEARNSFSRRAVNFLATRINAVRDLRERGFGAEWGRPAILTLIQTIGGKKVTTPGCNFTVSSNSSGLRVFWSGAYFISQNYFSHPTSPATSVLQTGIYVFGVDGGAYGNTIQWDTNAIVSLPGSPFVHLNF